MENTAIQNLNNTTNNNTSLTLERLRDYSLTELTRAGKIFGRLVINRDIDIKIIKKKKTSLLSIGGLAQAIIVEHASKCLEEGLEIEIITEGDAENIKVTKDYPELDKVLVPIDGNHRFAAIMEINQEIEAKNAKIENEEEKKPLMEAYFKLPLTDAPTSDLLREVNVATATWKSRDYIKHVASTQEANTQDQGVFQWISNEISNNKTGSERALWYFSSFSKDRTPTNLKLSAAAKNNDKYKSIINTENFKCGKEIYKALKDKFNVDFVRNEEVALYIVSLKDKVIAGNTSTKDFVEQFSTILQKYSSEDSFIKDAIISTREIEVEDKKGEKVTKQVKLKKDEKIIKYLSTLDKIILENKPEWYQLIKG